MGSVCIRSMYLVIISGQVLLSRREAAAALLSVRYWYSWAVRDCSTSRTPLVREDADICIGARSRFKSLQMTDHPGSLAISSKSTTPDTADLGLRQKPSSLAKAQCYDRGTEDA